MNSVKTGIFRPGASRLVKRQEVDTSSFQPREHADHIVDEAERVRWMCGIFGSLADVGQPIACDDFRTIMKIVDENLAVLEDEARGLRGKIGRATGNGLCEGAGRQQSAPSPRAKGRRR